MKTLQTTLQNVAVFEQPPHQKPEIFHCQPKQVIPKGFLLNVRCPTEERLTLSFDITELKDHVSFIYALQDLLTSINQKYSDKAKPKTCMVKYRKVTVQEKEVRRKILSFSPYPSNIINSVKNARKLLYIAISKNCLTIASEQFGNQQRNLYFLPANRASELISEVDVVNDHLQNAQEAIVKFEASEDASEIENFLKNTLGTPIKLNATLGRASVNPVPFSLSKDFLVEFVEDIKNMMQEVSKNKEEALSRLKEEIEARRIEMIRELERSLKEKIIDAINAIEAAKNKPTKELVNAVAAAANLAESMQLSIAPSLREAEKALREGGPSVASSKLVIAFGSMEALKNKIKSDPLLEVW